MKDVCDALGIQTSYGPVHVGEFIQAGTYLGGVDPADRRALTFTLATDSYFYWKPGGKSNTSRISMAEKIAVALTQEGKKFDVGSADLMAINGGDVGKWTSGARRCTPTRVEQVGASPHMGRQRQLVAHHVQCLQARQPCPRVRELGGCDVQELGVHSLHHSWKDVHP